MVVGPGESYSDYLERRNICTFLEQQQRQRESEYRPLDYGPGKCSL